MVRIRPDWDIDSLIWFLSLSNQIRNVTRMQSEVSTNAVRMPTEFRLHAVKMQSECTPSTDGVQSAHSPNAARIQSECSPKASRMQSTGSSNAVQTQPTRLSVKIYFSLLESRMFTISLEFVFNSYLQASLYLFLP